MPVWAKFRSNYFTDMGCETGFLGMLKLS